MSSEPDYRYRAFISYSRSDRDVVKKLQRLLEHYVLPAALRTISAGVTRGARPLAPCFRDEDELVPGQDLPDRIHRGLEASEYLIVVCSKSSAKSEWVEKEIIDFCRLGRNRQILALVIDGQPNASQASEEALPRSLRFKVELDGRITDLPVEALWIDWREKARNDRIVFLRVVAALLSLRSLDELVRRDAQARRRARISRSSLLAVSIVLFGVVGFAWFRARDAAQVQGIQQALSLSRADFADNRVDAGLQRLQPFSTGGHAELVEPVMRNVLGWATSIKRQYPNVSRPSLLRYRGALLLLDQSGTLHDLSGVEPTRIILARDGRRLLLIQNSQASVYDATNGALLSRIDTVGATWDSYVYEAAEGVLAVMGTFAGATNGGTNHFALTVSRSGGAIGTVFISPILALSGVAVAGGCQGLFVSQYADMGHNEVATLRFSSETLESARPLTSEQQGDSTAQSAAPFGALLQQDFPDRGLVHPHHDITGSEPFAANDQFLNPYVRSGCAEVRSDSQKVHSSQATTSLSDPLILATGADFEPTDHLVAVGPAANHPKARVTLCPQSAACPVNDGRGPGTTHTQGDQELNKFGMNDVYGTPPVPQGYPSSTTEFDSFEGKALLFEYYHYNSGVDLSICRMMGDRPRCYDDSASGDERRADGFIRSPTGRYLFWEMGGTVIDLKTLRAVMNQREIPYQQSQACNFTPNESQLACAYDGRLAFYRPNGPQGSWSQSATSPPIAPLQVGSGKQISGLLAIDNTQFIVAGTDGHVGRFDAAGTVQWDIHVAGIGQITGIVPSPNRAFVLLIGTTAARIINSDGFAQSAPLATQVLHFGETPSLTCLGLAIDSGTTELDNHGNLRVPCSGTSYVRSPQNAVGAVNSLLSGVICTPPENLAPTEALKSCIPETGALPTNSPITPPARTASVASVASAASSQIPIASEPAPQPAADRVAAEDIERKLIVNNRTGRAIENFYVQSAAAPEVQSEILKDATVPNLQSLSITFKANNSCLYTLTAELEDASQITRSNVNVCTTHSLDFGDQ